MSGTTKTLALSVLLIFPLSFTAAQQQWITLKEEKGDNGIEVWQAGIQLYDYFRDSNQDNNAARRWLLERTKARSFVRFYSVGYERGQRIDSEDQNVFDLLISMLWQKLNYPPLVGEMYYFYRYVDSGNRGWYGSMIYTNEGWSGYMWYYRVI